MNNITQFWALLSAVVLLPLTVPDGLENTLDTSNTLTEELDSATYQLPITSAQLPDSVNTHQPKLKV